MKTEQELWIQKYRTFTKYYDKLKNNGIQMKQKPSLDAYISAYKTKVAESNGSHNIPRDVAAGYAQISGKYSKTVSQRFLKTFKEHKESEMNPENKYGPQIEKIQELLKKKNPIAALQKKMRQDPSFKDILFEIGNRDDPTLFQKKAYKKQDGAAAQGVKADADGIKYYYVPTWIYSP